MIDKKKKKLTEVQQYFAICTWEVVTQYKYTHVYININLKLKNILMEIKN